MEDMSTADRVTGDHSNDGLGQVLDNLLQFESIQTRNAILTNVAALATDALIPTGAEGLLALTGENNNTNFGIVATEIKSLNQLIKRLWTESIPNLWAINRNLAYAIGFLKNNVIKVMDFLPFN